MGTRHLYWILIGPSFAVYGVYMRVHSSRRSVLIRKTTAFSDGEYRTDEKCQLSIMTKDSQKSFTRLLSL